MGFLRGLYTVFVGRPIGGFLLLVVNVLLMGGTILTVALVRRLAYGSYSLGADVLTGFLLGLMLVALFNSLVYFGAFGHPRSQA